jgi:Flp pilus assembly protein TadG
MRCVWKNFFVRSALARHLGAFRRANAGNVAITFALATLPIVGTVGFAVDYSHANAVKAAMQAALDSTALMLSRDAATLSNTDLQTKAASYFNSLFTRPEAKNVTITASYTTTGGSQLRVNGAAQVPTSFLGVIGYQNINVGGTATAAWGSSRLRVALALDNTGSMADDRQDRRPQDVDQKPTDATEKRRIGRWRRLRLNHPLQPRRQRRAERQL